MLSPSTYGHLMASTGGGLSGPRTDSADELSSAVGAGCCCQNAALLLYQGQGTNFSFTGHTAVHWAAAKGQVQALRWLLTHGAVVDAVNHAGSTPLHSAAGNGQV